MAYVDADGLIVPEPAKGDVLRMFYALRKGYGALAAPDPVLIVHHTTARWMREGEQAFAPGMPEMGKRVAKRPSYASIYVARDGQAVQVVRYGLACIGNEGHVVVDGKRIETNKVAWQIEWDNIGWCDAKGGRGTGAPTVSPKRADMIRNDEKVYPGAYWQNVPGAQAQAIAEICAAVVAKARMQPINALHGHYELGRKGHIDPGPQVIAALEGVVGVRLGLAAAGVAPARRITGPVPVVISTQGVS
jgi:hypothetical protein